MPPSATPILDLEQPFAVARKQGSRIRDRMLLIAAAFGTVIGAGATIALVNLLPAGLLSFFSLSGLDDVESQMHGLGSWLPFVMVLVFALTVIVHEAGHALIAQCYRFEVHEFRAGPLRFVRNAARWKFSLQWKFDVEGIVRFHPTSFIRARQRLIYVYAAGPAANLLTGIAALLLSEAGGFTPILRAASFLFALCSIFIGLANLVPYRFGKYMSDGCALVMLVFQRRLALQYLSMLGIQYQLRNGTAIKDLRRSWVLRSISRKGHPQHWFYANFIAREYAAWNEDYPLSRTCLERCLAYAPHVNVAVQNILIWAASATQAWQYGDVTKSLAWRERVRPPGFAPLLSAQLEFHIAVAERDRAKAERFWRECVDLLTKLQDSPVKANALGYFDHMKTEMERRLSGEGFEKREAARA